MQQSQATTVRPETLEHRRILIIEDEPDIAQLISLHLEDRYETVVTVHDGADGFAMANRDDWDLILLDLRLPGMEGLEVCRQLRAEKNYVPILMLTSKSSELDQVLGLEMGADDYVTKPFSVMELTSRVRAILRRVDLAVPKPEIRAVLSHDDIEVDLGQRRVAVEDEVIDLTAREFDLLCHFMRHPGEVFSRTQLLDEVWGYGHAGYEHTVNTHINRLRSKIESDPTAPTRLVTIWGVGYKLANAA